MKIYKITKFAPKKSAPKKSALKREPYCIEFFLFHPLVNVQSLCNGHFCWRCELASPAAEVRDNLRSRYLGRELFNLNIFQKMCL